ncbi:Synaptotagmin-11 [Amphibalanus amphitrite]|uniref:Synaptotagmin-11 n=1 Tax=Amphibalanus amphitrite TaxID=1232801 RepID=A0A6A4W4X1_AMPAM|nr:Synaptotagmin-11 [Amphibalanus amphitrite]
MTSVSSPALIGICLASTLLLLSVAAVTCFCYRRRSAAAHKLIYRRSADQPVGLRRPTAVRSPGSQGHYLKKSPSPTGKPATPGSGSEGGGEPPTDTGAHTPVLHTPSPAEDSKIRSIKCFSENELPEKPGKQEELPETSELGQLHFRVRYNSESAALVVTVARCEGLPARGGQPANSDPYVKLQLLPERQHKVKTRVLRNTLDPVYEEDFTFYGIQFNKLESTTLHFVVLSFDRYSRDDVIGEVLCPILTSLSNWYGKNGLKINAAKTQLIVLGTREMTRRLPPISINFSGSTIASSSTVKNLVALHLVHESHTATENAITDCNGCNCNQQVA